MRDVKQAGFSLTELMIVVAIVGILSAVALLSFRRYAVKVRVGEAYAMLGQIKARQEVYRAEFSQYDPAAQFPVGAPGEFTQQWDNAVAPAEWLMMGVKPDHDVYFVYEVLAGNPGAAAPIPWNPDPPEDYWFVARATGDLDGDGTQSMFELCSECRAVWVADEAPYEYEGR